MFTAWNDFESLLNLKISSHQQQQLAVFYDLLIVENQKHNLTRIIEPDAVFFKHIVDSLVFTKDFKIDSQNIIDLGTGAGFPGIILKIMFPQITITLLDASHKKINFLNQVIERLQLTKINTVCARAEVFAHQHNEEFDIVVSRAVAQADIILELSVRLLKINGHIILLKGPKLVEELTNINILLKKIFLRQIQLWHFYDERIGARINAVFLKEHPTPTQYPREYAKIVKQSNKPKKNVKGDKWV